MPLKEGATLLCIVAFSFTKTLLALQVQTDTFNRWFFLLFHRPPVSRINTEQHTNTNLMKFWWCWWYRKYVNVIKRKWGITKAVSIWVQLPIISYYMAVLVKEILDLCYYCFYKPHVLYTLQVKMYLFGLNIQLSRCICGWWLHKNFKDMESFREKRWKFQKVSKW